MSKVAISLWLWAAAIVVISLVNKGITFENKSETFMDWMRRELPAPGFQNEPERFRNLRWGDPPKENMEFLGREGPLAKFYILSDEELRIGDAHLTNIAYCFYGEPERLMAVVLRFEEEAQYETWKTICQGKFGVETVRGFYYYLWLGKRAIVRLAYDVMEEEGWLFLASRAILLEKMEAEQEHLVEEAEQHW